MFGHGGCGILGKLSGRMHAPWARHGGSGGECGGPAGWLRGADLTNEQVEKIAELGGEAFLPLAHAKLDMMGSFKELFKELSREEINRERVLEIAEKIKAQKSSLIDRVADKLLAFAEILTPEQRKRIRVEKIRQFMGLDSEVREA